MNIRRSRDGGGGLSEPSEMATVFRSGEWGTAANCRRLCRVVEKWAAPMCHLPCHYGWPDDCTEQAARGQDGQGWRNLAAVDGKVLAMCDGAGVQGGLRDRTDIRRRGSGI